MHPRTDHLIDLALDEDLALGDLTSRAIFPANHRSRGFIAAKDEVTVCGVEVAARVFARVDPRLRVRLLAKDGDRVRPGRVVLRVAGPTGSLLAAERTALNFLQRLSGVATQTRRFVAAVAGTGVRIADTRKTTPGLRALEKCAVRCGGGHNHRSTLGEHVLIKDNHLAAAGSIARAVARARAAAPHLARIAVEVTTVAEAAAACRAGADVVLLDNFTPARVRAAVKSIGGRALVEVSGGVTLATVRDFALPGVSVISIGALTHSAPAVDLSLTVEGPTR
ncbi:MAG: carboxylating nicotinate-nucleotide diphosphorylase [Verrucomicrobia bacterium]|nr:carboxylating nicotinate-nucleotide diphosphorylase [Verrucomicrobiota bacterium]